MLISAGIGAAYGTAKSGIGIAGVGTFRPDLIMKVRMACSKFAVWHLYLPDVGLVTDTGGYVGYYCGILARHCCPHCGRHPSTI